MVRRANSLWLLMFCCGCGTGATSKLADPIAEVPSNQQRVVDRKDFGWKWPFSVGVGTLGCDKGAVVFRHDGRSYAVNDAAWSRGFARIDSIWRLHTNPPTNPLSRIPQFQRQQIFEAAMACEGDRAPGTEGDVARCKQQLRQIRTLTEPELKQIEFEGRERSWKPLPQGRATLDPVLEEGLKLCQTAAS